jgi:four helix bundle protein
MGGVRRYEDFHAWRLSVELRDRIAALVDESKTASGNFKFKNQILDASSSPPRNIAEGFGRFRPKPFANFLRIARGSLMETRDLLQEGRSKRYFKAADVEPLLRLQARASKATLRLTQYLEGLPDDFDITSG